MEEEGGMKDGLGERVERSRSNWEHSKVKTERLIAAGVMRGSRGVQKKRHETERCMIEKML